jgi:[acyl-carrier-protein] S-malonyltransferase
MNAILFPGQGSQIVGMGSEFYNNFSIVKKIFEEADNKLNFKISKIILEGPDSVLKLTKNTQPAILIVSFAIFSVMKKEFDFDLKKTKYFAGHSRGEYSALVAAKSLESN